MYMSGKYILQKDVPDRMTKTTTFGLKRIMNSVSLINIERIFDKRLESHMKPSGFWYSLKWYWLANLAEDYHYDQIDYSIDDNRMYYISDKSFLYDIQIDDETFTYIGGKKGLDKIIQIRNQKDIVNFYEEYRYTPKDDDTFEIIDWKKVYMDYGGIELAVTHLEELFGKDIEKYIEGQKVGWWFGWDVASGCIWNGEVIKKIRWIL